MENEKHSNNKKIDTSLLIRYILGVSSEKEKSEVSAWLQDNTANESTLLQIAQLYYAQRTKQRIQARNSEAAFALIQRQQHKKTRRVFIKRLGTIAASIALFISVVLNYYHAHTRLDNSEIQYFTIQTNAGMRSQFTLPDGTEVYLNAGTKLTYPMAFNTDERRVELDGEGYFKVAHEAKRPFRINIADKAFELEVVGTEFNIQAYASDEIVKTTLIEGAVRLGMQTAPGMKKYVTLHPSQKAMYDAKNKNLHIEHVNAIFDTAWMHGKLMFKDTPLPEVLNRLSHFYNVHFMVDDPAINKYTFTGTFENRQLAQILDYLSISSQIEYKIIAPKEDDSKEVKQTEVILIKRYN